MRMKHKEKWWKCSSLALLFHANERLMEVKTLKKNLKFANECNQICERENNKFVEKKVDFHLDWGTKNGEKTFSTNYAWLKMWPTAMQFPAEIRRKVTKKKKMWNADIASGYFKNGEKCLCSVLSKCAAIDSDGNHGKSQLKLEYFGNCWYTNRNIYIEDKWIRLIYTVCLKSNR